MKNNLISIRNLLALSLLVYALAGCSHKKGKIRLYARDTTSSALLGHWVLTDSSAAKMNTTATVPGPYKITGMVLNDNHSASIYCTDSSAGKEKAGAWQWKEQKNNEDSSYNAEESPDTGGSTLLLITLDKETDTIPLKIIRDQKNGDTLLFIPHFFSYQKHR